MVLKIGAFVSVIIAIVYLNYYKKMHFDFFNNKDDDIAIKDVLYTVEELKSHNGVDSSLLYLSILGNVFDVTSGKEHYGPNSEYRVFIGRDASKSFITGEFSNIEDDMDDVLTLSHEDLLGLDNWKMMYDKKYIYKGKLIGRFYDEYGKETEYMNKVNDKIKEAKQIRIDMEKLSNNYPPCNMEWDATAGSKVWCSKKSGGIERDWEGVPRLLFTLSASEPRCVCARSEEEARNNKKLKEYQNCNPSATLCLIPKTDINHK